MRSTLESLWTSAKSYFVATTTPGTNTYTGGEESIETEDNSIVCRALRKYYVENGRPLPSWLPPSPRQRRTTIHIAKAQDLRTRRSVLSDLWDSPHANAPQSFIGGMSSAKRYSTMLRQRHSVNVLVVPTDTGSPRLTQSQVPQVDGDINGLTKNVIGAEVSVASKESRDGAEGEGRHLSSRSLRKKKRTGAEKPL